MSDTPAAPEGLDAPPPQPQATEPELDPGGADAIPGATPGGATHPPLPRDLAPAKNPAVTPEAPDAVTEPDDEKEQAPQSGTSGEGDTPDESPA